MSTAYYFIEALDVLMLRGNRSFGAAGEHSEAMLPPWPSVFAGAFRSALLAADTQRLAEFSAVSGAHFDTEEQRSQRMRDVLGASLFATLGTPQRPGDFRITWASLARRQGLSAQLALPLPADLVAQSEGQQVGLLALQPAPLPAGVSGSASLPMTALLRTPRQVKPASGHWLDGAGLAAHLQGSLPSTTLRTDVLYRRETRLGIALDAGSRTASDGALYTSEAVSFGAEAGFLVGIEGAPDLPATGLLRLGGDGRGARWQRLDFAPLLTPSAQGGRFRLVLTTPGVFSGGWLPEGVTLDADGSCRLRGEGFSARLACAALPRHEVVSGWDLVRWAPKTAQRVVPAGAVYWFDRFEGDAGKLATWVAGGLWRHHDAMDADSLQRRAEGFNNALLGTWAHGSAT